MGTAEMSEKEEESNGVRIWSWGAGTDGQLGNGNLEDEYFPQPLLDLPCSSSTPISFVACGGAHCIALTGDGRVLTWGRGTKGQLGHGELVNCLNPKLVKSFEGITISYVSAGWNHSGFVTDSGRLFMCGEGSFGQLGIGDHKSRSSPAEVFHFGSNRVEQVACGMRHSLVLAGENKIYGFGSARHGQIGSFESVPYGARPCNNLPRVIPGFENHKIVHICANGDQSAALSADGQLYTWGRGFGGSSSSHSPSILPSSLRFSQVSLGWHHALVLSDGEVYMLGGKRHGSLNISRQSSTSSAQCIPDGRVPCIEGEKVVHIAAGAEHSSVVTEKGEIMTWGWGEHGQLGLGSTDDQTQPRIVDIGYGRSMIGARVGLGVFCGSGFTLVVKLAL